MAACREAMSVDGSDNGVDTGGDGDDGDDEDDDGTWWW